MNLYLHRALLATLAVLIVAFGVFAQGGRRDHLTPQEIDLVKENQVLDKRIEVFVKAAERRLLALNSVTAPATKQAKKDSEKWGELPTGTRTELIRDLAQILDDAIINIDDVSEHDRTNVLIPKAVRKLSAAANGFLPQLNALAEQAKDEEERSAIGKALENAQSIIEAGKNLPAPTKKK
ncbi:MAG: hypothetical protein QOD75_3417 [Blastocatellia bacterium]|jgi:hypothetical protein|nr:hypothetical protein [Blastocatellia bacterium]